jgi:hypothetical protein
MRRDRGREACRRPARRFNRHPHRLMSPADCVDRVVDRTMDHRQVPRGQWRRRALGLDRLQRRLVPAQDLVVIGRGIARDLDRFG